MMFNVRSKADVSQLNRAYYTEQKNKKWKNNEKIKKAVTLVSIGNMQFWESVESVLEIV